MRLFLMGAFCALAIATAATAAEPGAGQISLTLGGGVNVPAANDTDNGYIIGGGLGYHVSERLLVGAEVSYLGYGDPVDGPNAGLAVNEHNIDYLGTAKYFLSAQRTAPYVKGLVGRYDYSLEMPLGTTSVDYTYSDLVYGGGVGLLIRGDSESNLYFEALARQMQVDEGVARLYTFTVGMDVSFLP